MRKTTVTSTKECDGCTIEKAETGYPIWDSPFSILQRERDSKSEMRCAFATCGECVPVLQLLFKGVVCMAVALAFALAVKPGLPV